MLQEFPVPTTRQELQNFVGMANFYQRFLPGATTMLLPLTEALKGGKAAKFLWTLECQTAFQSTKSMLPAAVELHHPVHGAPVSLCVNASGTHVGGVFQQFHRGVN